MVKRLTIPIMASLFSLGIGNAQANDLSNRALWASINGADNASLGDYKQHTGKVLVSWRMLPDMTPTRASTNGVWAHSTHYATGIYNLSGQQVSKPDKAFLLSARTGRAKKWSSSKI